LVFNGLKGSIAGNFGNSSRASSPSEVFGDAWVFHAANEKRSIGFANGGDWVLLSTPRGRPVHCVWWGSFDERLPSGAGSVLEKAPSASGGSVVRVTDPADPVEGPFWVEHPERNGLPLSPGTLLEIAGSSEDDASDGGPGAKPGGDGG
ncbi:MAG: hypothetical protein AAF108_01515, partial [Planctomycetota bacterium]